MILPSHKRVLIIVIALSVAARLASALYQGTTIQALPGVADQISYHELAVRVLDGHGFSFGSNWWPATRANEPTAHWSYFYVLFLAAIYAVTGPAPLVARIVQALLVGVLHPLLMWRIGRRLFGPAVGLVSAGLTAFYGYFVFYAGALVTESLYIAAILWLLDLSTSLPYARTAGGTRPKLRSWAALGLALAAAILLRQAFLLVVPLVLGWILWASFTRRLEPRGQALASLVRGLAVAAAIVMVCVLPWTVRNYKAFGQFVLLNTNAGYVFFWANHPIHRTEFIPILPNSTSYGSLLPKDLRGLNEAELDRTLLIRGLGFVRDDPWRYARLSLSRSREYFKFWPSRQSGLTSNVIRVLSFGLVLPFMLTGLVLIVTNRVPAAVAGAPGGGLLVLLATAYSLIHLLTWTLVRYRLPVDAILMPVAALSVVILYRRLCGLAYVSRGAFGTQADSRRVETRGCR